MAKIGYLMAFPTLPPLGDDRAWMEAFGCGTIYEEVADDEKRRPQWKQLMTSLQEGDVVVISKFSHALRGSRELVAFLALCHLKMIRLISIHDRVDTEGKLFPDTSPADLLTTLATLPRETMELRKQASPARSLKGRSLNFVPQRRYCHKTREQKERTVINMYVSGYDLDDIRMASGYQSRSSIFHILNNYHIPLNRGPHCGPLKKKG